ncbi:MAG: hypothetical protein AAF152_04430 [Cyanobacteria bacterium P01_A01_bin.114]
MRDRIFHPIFKRLFRHGVQIAGRRIDLSAMPWLQDPQGSCQIGADFFERLAAARGWQIQENVGLLPSFSELAGATFSPERVHPQVRHFYEHTADYQMTIWSVWNGLFRPFGALMVHGYCRKIQQFNLPLSPLDTCYGVTNRVISLAKPGQQDPVYAAWIRCNARTGVPMYVSNFASIDKLPGCPSPCIKVVFPLPQGSAMVFLQPFSQHNSLLLTSQGKRFGEPGLYLIQRGSDSQARVAYVSLFQEQLRVFVDEHNQLRADHLFKIGGFDALKLHYRFDRVISQSER